MFKYKLKCYFMMNSRGQFERELRQLVELARLASNNNNKPENDDDLWLRVKYYAAQESFMSNDLPAAFRHLILNYTGRLGTTLQSSLTSTNDSSSSSGSSSPENTNNNNSKKRPYGLDQLEALAGNDLKLSLVTESNLAKSLHNDFFLNLITNTQSIVEWLAKQQQNNDSASSMAGLISGRVSTCFLLNNLGVLNFALKKYAMGSLFAKKALLESRRVLIDYNEKKSKIDENNKTQQQDDATENRGASFAINKSNLGNTGLLKVKK